MDELREGVGLQAYGQRDPLVVYKTEGYRMYQRLPENIQHDVVHTLFRVQPVWRSSRCAPGSRMSQTSPRRS